MTEQSELYKVPLLKRFRRGIMRAFFKMLINIVFKVEIVGVENLPKGAYIIAYNHVSLFEPPLILAFWPIAIEALAGDDILYRPAVGPIARGYGALPVKRGEYDRTVMDTMIAMLKGGRPLAMAPEGTRSHKPGMQQALAGVAYLVDVTQAPILPVAIEGTHDDSLRDGLKGKRPKWTMHIGKPFKLPPIEGKGKARRAARQNNADQIMIEIAKMLPEKYHGVYAGRVPQD